MALCCFCRHMEERAGAEEGVCLPVHASDTSLSDYLARYYLYKLLFVIFYVL